MLRGYLKWWCASLLLVVFVGLLLSTDLLLYAQNELSLEDETETLVTPGIASESSGQPIAFSHAHHAGQYQIECQFCHAYARRSSVAGIPSVERCVGCHLNILSERPEIQKILEYWEKKEPIPWIRVHNLPDYVRFTHKAHVRVGLDCSNCHGDLTRMEIAQKVKPLTMGWCLDCHTERGASRDCLACHY